MNTGTKVDRLITVEPRVSLKVLVRSKLLSRFEPFVTGPSLLHWKTARMISPKPRVAIAR